MKILFTSITLLSLILLNSFTRPTRSSKAVFVSHTDTIKKQNILLDSIVKDTVKTIDSFLEKDTIVVEATKKENVEEYNWKPFKTNTKASYYHRMFNGRTTANGEIFQNSKISVAHKSLPFGTMLKVTNRRNGKSIVVRVNDRGPYIKGREVDLSKAAFDSIGKISRGILNVDIEIAK